MELRIPFFEPREFDKLCIGSRVSFTNAAFRVPMMVYCSGERVPVLFLGQICNLVGANEPLLELRISFFEPRLFHKR